MRNLLPPERELDSFVVVVEVDVMVTSSSSISSSSSLSLSLSLLSFSLLEAEGVAADELLLLEGVATSSVSCCSTMIEFLLERVDERVVADKAHKQFF